MGFLWGLLEDSEAHKTTGLPHWRGEHCHCCCRLLLGQSPALWPARNGAPICQRQFSGRESQGCAVETPKSWGFISIGGGGLWKLQSLMDLESWSSHQLKHCWRPSQSPELAVKAPARVTHLFHSQLIGQSSSHGPAYLSLDGSELAGLNIRASHRLQRFQDKAQAHEHFVHKTF